MRKPSIPSPRGRSKRFGRGAAATALLATSVAATFGLGASPAGAATFTVTNTNDAGAGSLRAAITSANATPGVDTINFNITAGASPVKTIDLITPYMVTEPLIINGRSQSSVANNAGVAFPEVTVGTDAVVLPAVERMEIQIRLDDYVTNPGGPPGSQADNPFAGVADYPCATSPAYGGYFTGAFCSSANLNLSGIAFQGFPDNEFQTNDDPINGLDDNQEASNTYVGLTNGASNSYIHDNFFGLTANGGRVDRNAPFGVQTDPSTPLQSAQTTGVRVQGNVGSSSGATVSTHYDRDWVTSGNRFNGLVNAYRDLGSTDMTVSENSIRPLPSFVEGFTTGGDAFLFQPFGRSAARPGYNARPTVNNNTIVNAGRFTPFGTPGEAGAVYTQVSGMRAAKNVITNSGGPAFKVSGAGAGLPFAGNNVISRNSLSGNGTAGSENEGIGINLFPASGAGANGDNPWRTPNGGTRAGGNDLIEYPTFTATDVCGEDTVEVSGRAPAGSTVEIFTVGTGGRQGRTYLGNTTASGSGTWSTTVTTTATTLTSTATIPGGTDGTSEFSPDVTVDPSCADLAITKTSPEDFRFQAGGNIPWTLNVSNLGPADATDFSVEDFAPDGATISAVDSPQGSVAIAADGKSFTISGLDLDSGDSFAVAVTGVAPATDVPDTLTNTSEVVPGDQVDPDLSNNKDNTGDPTDPDYVCAEDEPTCDVVERADADLAIVKTSPEDFRFQAGGNIPWTLTVTNNGPVDATNFSVEDFAPDGATITAVDAPQGTVTIADDAKSFTITGLNLDNGDSFTVDVTGQAPTEDVPETLTNTSKVVPGDQTDPDLSNNEDDTGDPTDPDYVCPDGEATCDVVSGAIADVKVTKTANTTDPIQPGDTVGWTVDVENLGPDTAIGVVLTDLFGNGTDSIISATPEIGTCEIDGTRFTCDLGDLAAGDATSVLVESATADDLEGIPSVWNYAKAESVTPDPDPTNNEDDAGRDPENPGAPVDPECVATPDECYTGDTNVPVAAADVAVTKTVKGDSTVKTGGTVTFDLVVENLGPDKALNVVAADEQAEGLKFQTMRITSESEGVEGLAVDGQILTADVLPAGAKVTLEADFTVTATEGTVKNVWFAQSTTPDPDPTNNIDDGPADPLNPTDEDADCTEDFVGCSSITVEEVPVTPSPTDPPATTPPATTPPSTNPPVTKAPVTPTTPSNPEAPSKPAPPTTNLAYTGGSILLALVAGGLLLSGFVLVRRRKGVSAD